MDESTTQDVAGTGGTSRSLDAAARELADAVHRAAVLAGGLDEIARDTDGPVDPDTQLVLDQAHSNATAIVAVLGELGYG